MEEYGALYVCLKRTTSSKCRGLCLHVTDAKFAYWITTVGESVHSDYVLSLGGHIKRPCLCFVCALFLEDHLPSTLADFCVA